MGKLELFLVAVGLSMDAFAVSVTDGMVNRGLGRKKRVFIAATFGAFQGLMPLIGYVLGSTFSGVVRFMDHWIAFVLLGFIGGKMIADAVKESGGSVPELFSVRLVLMQGIATSIDALAVGVSFAVMRAGIFHAAFFIAAVTFLCCLAGVQLGRGCGALLKGRAQVFGGCVLILIGLKIFIEHVFFS